MNSMYCAEQINIPPELGSILKQYTKAVIKERPADVYKFSANFFASLSGSVPPFDQRGQLVSGEGGRQATTTSSKAGGDMVDDVIPGAGDFEAVQDEQNDAEAVISTLFKQYDNDGSGRIERKELPALISDLRATLGWDDEERKDLTPEAIINMFDTDNDGTIGLSEFRQLFFQDY
eukprot:GILI01019158.1.p1 GENE.GILI01019158.1~~GILI01019158.1.p1  ORF type:complete len:176 (-),score=40.03 GILI01019158.1:165-692(-)